MRLTLALLFLAAPGLAVDSSTVDQVVKISQVERSLPWFWSRTAEGLADIPYTYRQRWTRGIRTERGKEIPPDPKAGGLNNWRVLELERIPLDWGAFMRCLSQDGRASCSDEWTRELDRQADKRTSLTAEHRARIDRTRAERRERRRAFWDRFPAAMKFEAGGPHEIRFTPRQGGPTLLGAMSGRLWFDPATWRVTRLEYDLLRDVDEVFGRLPKGAHFEIALELSTDGDYVPRRLSTRQKRPKSNDIEDSAIEFSHYQRFDSKTTIRFGDQL